MKSAMGDYQALAKMANEDPKLLKVKVGTLYPPLPIKQNKCLQ